MERVADLKTNYGITSYTYTKLSTTKYPSISEKRLNELMAEYKRDMVAILPTLESAFSLLGSGVAKKITGYYTANVGHFTLAIGSPQLNSDWIAGEFGSGGTLTFYNNTNYPANTLLQEIGHAYDLGLLGGAGNSAMTTVGNSESPKEDFAMQFAWMIERGSSTPYGTHAGETKGSTAHKKYIAIYELMLRDFGADSTAVKRAAAFLGIK